MRVCAIALVVLTMSACSSGGGGEESTGASGEQTTSGEEIRIGMIASQSGPFAALGVVEVQAAQLLVDQTNASGGINGRMIRLDVSDDQSRPDVAATEARRLLSEDVSAIIGPSVTESMFAVLPVLEGQDIPILVMTPVAYPNFNQEPWVFSPVFPDVQDNFFVMFSWMKDHGAEKIGLVLAEGAQGDGDVTASEGALAEVGGLDSAVVRIPLGANDYTSTLATLQSEGVQAIYTGAQGETSAVVRKNVVQLGWDIPVFTHTGNAGQFFVELLGDAAEGMKWYTVASTFPQELDAGPQKDLIVGFVAAFEEKYGQPPSDNVLAGIGYDSLLSIIEAIRSSGSSESAAIRDALETQQLVAMNGTVNRTATNHVGVGRESVFLAEWSNGQFVRLG